MKTQVKLKFNTNFLNHFPVTHDILTRHFSENYKILKTDNDKDFSY